MTVSRVAAAILATALTAAALAGPAHATHTTAWKAPTEGATVSGVLQGDECEATSSSPLGVERVEFYVDGALHNTERNAPYNCWNLDSHRLTEGAHVLKARGITKGGAVSEHSINVTADNVPDEEPPPPPGPPKAGMVKYMRIMNSAFDSYISAPTDAQKQWMRDHYDRALVYSPSFDTRTSWFPRGWVYHDSYAIYRGGSTATEHPEWILRDSSGNRLYIPYECSGGTCTQYAGDIGSSEFRQHIIGEIRAKLNSAAPSGGYKGVFVDDVNMDFRVGDGNGTSVRPIDPRTGAPMTLADWRRYFAEFMEEIDRAFPDHEIVHNPHWWTLGEGDPYVERQAKAADYLNFERGVNDAGIVGGTDKFGYETFLAQAARFNVIFESGVRSPDEPALEYGLASYFLVNDGRDLVSNHRWRGTPDDWWSAGYDLDLGGPLGPRYSWEGLLRRDFERGSALVNQPDTSTRTVTLPETYLDLAGNPRTSVTLAPASGTVLRKR